MVGPHRAIAVALLVAGFGGVAGAERIAITNVHSEPDVADEAGAVTLLVRTALAGTDRTLLEAPSGLVVGGAAAVLQKVGADHGVLIELSRDGIELRVSLAIVGDGEPDISLVRAGDGDVHALAKGIVDKVTAQLHLEPSRVPDVSLGRLRPYVTAIRLRASDPIAAARALSFATPATVLAVPAAADALRGLSSAVGDPALAILAARAIGDAKQLDALGAAAPTPGVAVDTTPTVARAFAAIARTNLRAADAELASIPKPRPTAHGGTVAPDPLVTLLTATLAELHADDKRLNELLQDGLGTDRERAILALASTIVAARLGTVHRALVIAAEKTPDAPGVASRIGLAAAEAGVEPQRALALVSVRELDDYELKRLEPLIVQADEGTAARLAAELAIRRVDPASATAVAKFLTAAPDDPRAHRYHAWGLLAKNRPAEAAAELAKAGQRREQGRALLLAGDLKGALAAIDGKPTSPEELVVVSRLALADNKLDLASSTLLDAERAAPVNPLVQAAVLEVTTRKPDPARASLARSLVERGTGHAALVAAPPPVAGSAAPPTPIAITPKPEKKDDELAQLDGMLASLADLRTLPNRKLAIEELRWSAPLTSFRKTQPDVVRTALADRLAAQPYRLQLSTSGGIDGRSVDTATLNSLVGTADAVLVYRVEPDGASANVTLMLFPRGAAQAQQTSRTLAIAGVVGFATGKLILLLVLIAGLGGGGFVWFNRATGRIRVVINRTTDPDEVLCVELSRKAVRPKFADVNTFQAETRRAGASTKSRSATLVGTNVAFTVPIGAWYVHLYGATNAGGRFRAVADTFTKNVDLKRGDSIEVVFDLISQGAEITVHVETHPKQGVAVWANDDEKSKVLTDDAGDALLILPVGNHVIHIDAHGTSITKPLEITAPKVQVLTINMTRELRFINDVELSPEAADGPIGELDLAPEPVKSPSQPQGLKLSFRDPGSGPGTTPPVAKGTAKGAATIPLSAEVYAATQASGSAPGAAPSQSAPQLAAPTSGSGPKISRTTTPIAGDVLFGRYKIVAEIGRGAMGVVHRARDEKLERDVAIKEMAEDLRKMPEAMALFLQEAKALAQLNHTNIVAMYDQVTDVDKVYMIMEYVDGKPLEEIVDARGAIPWLEAISIVDQVCAALAYAHARKVIHRDIKPANVFVANDKIVKLGDFGLARVMREVTIRRTEIRGTPLYMAPEQITGTDVDHRTDLYAVGCTLFELVCGRPPFIDGDIMYAQMNKQPPLPSSLTPGLPTGLDALIMSLLAKDADDRPGSANEVRATFRDLSSF